MYENRPPRRRYLVVRENTSLSSMMTRQPSTMPTTNLYRLYTRIYPLQVLLSPSREASEYLFNQTSAPLSTLLLTFCLAQNSRNTQNYLSLSRWFTLALDSTEWHSFHCACLAGCQLMCFVFIRFHRASRRDEVCDKFCVFNFFCSLVFYSLLINQFCVFREFRVKKILLSHRLYPYFGNAPP